MRCIPMPAACRTHHFEHPQRHRRPRDGGVQAAPGVDYRRPHQRQRHDLQGVGGAVWDTSHPA